MKDHHRYSGKLERAERREFLPFLNELAAVSAAVIRPFFMQGTAVETKSDDSPVTAADRRAEEVMRLLITQRYADHGILGEEFGEHQPQARYRWVLDPIDGTKAFISNCFIFGTLIALQRDGLPILGAIASPLTGLVLAGLGGEETLLGERAMRVRDCHRIEDATVLTTGHWEMLDSPRRPRLRGPVAASADVPELGRLPRLLPGRHRRRRPDDRPGAQALGHHGAGAGDRRRRRAGHRHRWG